MTTHAMEVLTNYAYFDRPAISRGYLLSIRFALAVTVAPSVCPRYLSNQHRDKRGQKPPQQACVEEVRCLGDLYGGTIPHPRSDRVFVWSHLGAELRKIEIDFRPFAGVWLQRGLDVDDEGGADRRE